MTVRQFLADGALIPGGARAILLQVADPVVARGVAEHSDFAVRPMARLRNTLTFVYAVMLGTPEQASLVSRFVDLAHEGIEGATDARHQLWVAATLYESAMSMHVTLFGPLDDDSADEVYHAYAALGTALQVPAGDWPADRAAFAEYWNGAIANLQVTDAARQVARDLLNSRTAAWWVRLAMPLERVLTIGMLPQELRDAYELEHRPRAYRAAIWFVRVLARLTPRRVREWPSRHYLRRLHAR